MLEDARPRAGPDDEEIDGVRYDRSRVGAGQRDASFDVHVEGVRRADERLSNDLRPPSLQEALGGDAVERTKQNRSRCASVTTRVNEEQEPNRPHDRRGVHPSEALPTHCFCFFFTEEVVFHAPRRPEHNQQGDLADMLSTLSPDMLLHVATLLQWQDAFSLQWSCKYALLVINVRPFWRGKALQCLLSLQARQLGTTRLRVPWEGVLDTSSMSYDEARRVCRRADCNKPAARGYVACLLGLLDGSKSHEACRRHLRRYLRSEPSAYLFNGLVACGVRQRATTVSLCASSTGVVDIMLSHGSGESVVQDLLPATMSARIVVTNDHRTSRDGGRTASDVNTAESTPRFGRCFLYLKTSPVFVNLALLMERMPHSTAWCALAALPAIVALRGEHLDVTLMFALQAIVRDSVDGFRESMQRLKLLKRGVVGRNHGSMCLCLETMDDGVVTLTRPYYVSAMHTPKSRLHRRLAQMLEIDDGTIYWPHTIVHSTTRRVFQVQIDFFMLYTQDLCPRVHAWWMRNAVPFSHTRVADIRRCVARYNLPPIQRVPVVGGVVACVTD